MNCLLGRSVGYLTLASLCFLSGCVTLPATPSAPQYTAHYEIALNSVERQARGAQADRSTNVAANTFEDELIKINWRPNTSQLVFQLTNKSDGSIRLLWDEVSFVDTSGKTSRVIHEGVKIADRGQSMPPTVLVRGATLEDLVEPASNIYWRRGYGTYDVGGWEHTPLVPDGLSAPTESDIRARMVPDSSMKVLLPLEINGTTREYLFEFSVVGRVIPPPGA